MKRDWSLFGCFDRRIKLEFHGARITSDVLTGEQPQWLKVALTYAVPFFVSSYGAY